MKIEKINDSQIRCTLSKEDLLDRELRISELAYGSDKAKALFNDMIQQASYECGFVADDLPLMIEAIPVSPECLVLVITKVDDPDELDTRFSNFTPCADQDEEEETPQATNEAYADEILNCFKQLNELLEDKAPEMTEKSDAPETESPIKPDIIQTDFAKVYSFTNLETISAAAKVLSTFYHGLNTLYKNPRTGIYYLVLSISDHTAEVFNKVCNIVSEYGVVENASYASASHYQEHFECIIKDKAVEVLAKL